MSEVKRWYVDAHSIPGRSYADAVVLGDEEVVLASDYGALEAENQRLREALNYASRDLDPEDIIEIQAILYGEQGENDE